jgi:hypothetical protein
MRHSTVCSFGTVETCVSEVPDSNLDLIVNYAYDFLSYIQFLQENIGVVVLTF